MPAIDWHTDPAPLLQNPLLCPAAVPRWAGKQMVYDIRPKLSALPRNIPPRTIAIAPAVAIVVAISPALIAINKELRAARLNLADSTPVKRSTYQRVEKPPHLVIDKLSLNE